MLFYKSNNVKRLVLFRKRQNFQTKQLYYVEAGMEWIGELKKD